MLHDEIYKIKSTTSNLSCVNEISSNHMYVHDIYVHEQYIRYVHEQICHFGTARQNKHVCNITKSLLLKKCQILFKH